VAKAANPREAVPEAPSAKSFAPVVKVLAPLRRIAKPKFYGIEHVPKGGALLVGNHTLYGVFDLMMLSAELIDRGIVVRGLILVFPGGAREVAKRKGEQYQLIWKNRLGFAVMAIEGRYPVVPFASLGMEDALDVVLDTDKSADGSGAKTFREAAQR
jgi:1-acyl-sn-glycerol-3-phosphate acyltransferase